MIISGSSHIKLAKCDECPLNGAPKVPGHGNDNPTMIVVAEAPGRNEAKDGIPMVGRSGELLNSMLKDLQSSRDKVYVTNTVLCRPTDANNKDAPPSIEAVKACEPRLTAELASLPSQVVVATGATSSQALTGLKGKHNTISKLQGSTIWSEKHQKFIISSYHPAYVLRSPEGFDDVYDAFQVAHKFGSGLVPLPSKDITAEIDYDYCTDVPSITLGLLDVEREVKAHEAPFYLACDTETQYADDPNYGLFLIQLSTTNKTWVFEFQAMSQNNRRAFTRLMLNEKIRWVFHNSCFDLMQLQHNFNAVPINVEDTMALALCLTEKVRNVGLKKLSRKWLGAPYYEAELEPYGRIGPENPMGSFPREVVVKYGAYDARYTARLWPLLKRQVELEGNYHLYESILVPAQRAFSEMQYHGIKIDVPYIKNLQQQVVPVIEKLRTCLVEFAESKGFDATKINKNYKPNTPFNPSSVPMKKNLLYDVLKYPVVKAETGKPTTGKLFYQRYPDAEITDLIQRYQQVTKIKSTYLDGFERAVYPDGRVHANFQIWGARTGRISATNPPVQTLNRDNTQENRDFSPSLRRMLVAPEGYVFCEADYNALELYMAYHYSEDEAIKAALDTGDFHRPAAANQLGIPVEQVTSFQRDEGKRVTYGIMYGMQEQGLVKAIGGAPDRARKLVANWFAGFPKYHAWWNLIKEEVTQTQRLMTPTGRIRRWDFIADEKMYASMLREAVNFPLQSLANDLCLLALIELNRELQRRNWGRVIMMFHDSIETELKKQHLNDSLKLIHDIMTTPKFRTPIDYFPIGVKLGPNWGDVEEVEVRDVASRC